MASIFISVPKFFEFTHIYDENGTLQYWTSDLNENATYVVFSSYYECLMIGIIPLVALCFLNYKIYIGIHHSTELQARYSGAPIELKNALVYRTKIQRSDPNLQKAEFHPLVIIDSRSKKSKAKAANPTVSA